MESELQIRLVLIDPPPDVDFGIQRGAGSDYESMKVPLQGITWPLIRKATSKPGYALVARIPGTGKDGGPNCATVRLLGEWELTRR